MDEPPAHPPKANTPWGCWLFAVVVLIGLVWLAIPSGPVITDKANATKTANNCRQLLLAMKIYAEDNDGQYPTGASANEVFRQLIQVGILEDELIFGCPVSPFVPDGDIGESPDYLQAACPGEVHWMVADGLDRKSPGHLGLVFENGLDATWPPHWDPKAKGEPVRGRTWGCSGFIGGSAKVVIGRNDGSATLEVVDPKTGLLECQSRPDTPFPVPQGKLKLLEIRENKP